MVMPFFQLEVGGVVAVGEHDFFVDLLRRSEVGQVEIRLANDHFLLVFVQHNNFQLRRFGHELA